MISPLMVSSKNVKVSQKRCLGTSIESFTDSSLSEQIVQTTILSLPLSRSGTESRFIKENPL